MKSYCYYNDSENLTISIKLRKGKEDLDGVRVSLISNSSSESKDYNKDIVGTGFQINLDGFSNNLLKDGEIELIELVPYFLLDSGLKYMCSGSSLKIENIESCTGEISLSIAQDAQEYTENTSNSGSSDSGSEEESPEEPEEPLVVDTRFISKWNTSLSGYSSSNQIKLPLVSGGSYNFNVDWGDDSGVETITLYSQATHTYASEGVYEVIIDGIIEGFNFNYYGNDVDKLIEISQWGNLKLGNNGGYFNGASNLEITATDILNTTGITDFSEMFRQSVIANIPNIGEWDMSSAIDISYMFYYSDFNSDVGVWDVSNVTNMKYLFGATIFNQPLNNWNVSKVENMYGMFWSDKSFNQPLNNWDVSNVIDMHRLFRNAESFNQSLSNWDVSSVTDMIDMFYAAYDFNQNLSMWNVNIIEPTNFAVSSQIIEEPNWVTIG